MRRANENGLHSKQPPVWTCRALSRLLCPVLLAGTLLIVMRSTRGFSLQQSVAFTGVGVQRSWVGRSISRSRLSIKVPSGTSRCRVPRQLSVVSRLTSLEHSLVYYAAAHAIPRLYSSCSRLLLKHPSLIADVQALTLFVTRYEVAVQHYTDIFYESTVQHNIVFSWHI